MGYKSRKQIRLKQKIKRHKKRIKLSKSDKNPDELFYSGNWVGPRKGAAES